MPLRKEVRGTITIKLTPKQADILDKAAAGADTTTSEFARTILFAALEHDPVSIVNSPVALYMRLNALNDAFLGMASTLTQALIAAREVPAIAISRAAGSQ